MLDLSKVNSDILSSVIDSIAKYINSPDRRQRESWIEALASDLYYIEILVMLYVKEKNRK